MSQVNKGGNWVKGIWELSVLSNFSVNAILFQNKGYMYVCVYVRAFFFLCPRDENWVSFLASALPYHCSLPQWNVTKQAVTHTAL